MTTSFAGAVCADTVAEIHVVGSPVATETSATVSAVSAVVVPAVISMLCVVFGAPAISVAAMLSLETTIVGFGGGGGGGGGGCVTVCCELDESEPEQEIALVRTHATANAARLSRAGTEDMRCGGKNRAGLIQNGPRGGCNAGNARGCSE